MLKASTIPEVWPAGPATRPCHGSYFQHPLSKEYIAFQAATGGYAAPVYYDNYGHCNPSLMASLTLPAPVVQTGLGIGSLFLIGGVAFLAWRYRKRLF